MKNKNYLEKYIDYDFLLNLNITTITTIAFYLYVKLYDFK
jgi:hypothetical protein